MRDRYEHETKTRKEKCKQSPFFKKKLKKVDVYDHHEAHAASAYFYSGWKKCYVLTIDGWGDDSFIKII